jgi:hypothetical protein
MARTKIDPTLFNVQAPIQATSTTAFSTTSTSFQTTNLSASITPTNASRRVKITVHGVLDSLNQSTMSALLTIARGTTDLSTGNGFTNNSGNVATLVRCSASMMYIDSPATTSSVTYNVRLRGDTNSSTVTFGAACVQTIILEEVL